MLSLLNNANYSRLREGYEGAAATRKEAQGARRSGAPSLGSTPASRLPSNSVVSGAPKKLIDKSPVLPEPRMARIEESIALLQKENNDLKRQMSKLRGPAAVPQKDGAKAAKNLIDALRGADVRPGHVRKDVVLAVDQALTSATTQADFEDALKNLTDSIKSGKNFQHGALRGLQEKLSALEKRGSLEGDATPLKKAIGAAMDRLDGKAVRNVPDARGQVQPAAAKSGAPAGGSLLKLPVDVTQLMGAFQSDSSSQAADKLAHALLNMPASQQGFVDAFRQELKKLSERDTARLHSAFHVLVHSWLDQHPDAKERVKCVLLGDAMDSAVLAHASRPKAPVATVTPRPTVPPRPTIPPKPAIVPASVIQAPPFLSEQQKSDGQKVKDLLDVLHHFQADGGEENLDLFFGKLTNERMLTKSFGEAVKGQLKDAGNSELRNLKRTLINVVAQLASLRMRDPNRQEKQYLDVLTREIGDAIAANEPSAS